jgi:hypothetical protein
MAAVAIYEARHGSGKQTIKLGATFMRRHAVGVQGIGAFHRCCARNQRCTYRRKANQIALMGQANCIGAHKTERRRNTPLAGRSFVHDYRRLNRPQEDFR